MNQFTSYGQQNPRYSSWGESSEWNDAEGRKWEAIRRLRQFGKANPEYGFFCEVRIHALTHQLPNTWPLGNRPGSR